MLDEQQLLIQDYCMVTLQTIKSIVVVTVAVIIT